MAATGQDLMAADIQRSQGGSIRIFGTPSAANLRINAQSSKVITLQSLSAHFRSGRTAQFSPVIDSGSASPSRDGVWQTTVGWSPGFRLPFPLSAGAGQSQTWTFGG